MEIIKKLKKIKKKYLVFGGVAIIAILYFVFHNGNGEKPFVLVERGDLVQELFETGSTEKGEDVRLSFIEGGRVEKVFVKEGEKIKKGDVVVTTDKRDLELSLREAEANLISAQASYQKVVDGAEKEELDVVISAVTSAENNLEEQEKVASETLKTVYQGVSSLLGDVFTAVKEIEIGVSEMVDNYFTTIVFAETTSGKKSKEKIEESVAKIEDYKELVKREVSFGEKEEALSFVRDELKTIINELDNFVSISDSDVYKEKFSDADKAILRGYRGTVNGLFLEVVSTINSLSSTNAEINAQIVATKGVLNQAEKELARVLAGASNSNLLIGRATVDQAIARVELLRKRIADATLRSPAKGTVSSVFVQEGEVVAPGGVVVVLSPEKEVQIALDIYEGDVAKIKVGNDVTASFVAFSEEKFTGKIVSINPTGKVVDNVIYYPIKVVLDDYPENVLPQMTVDITIKTNERKDVLLLPEKVIYKRDGKQFVKVLEGEEEVEKEIIIGLRGGGRIVEIVSGVKEGEKILE